MPEPAAYERSEESDVDCAPAPKAKPVQRVWEQIGLQYPIFEIEDYIYGENDHIAKEKIAEGCIMKVDSFMKHQAPQTLSSWIPLCSCIRIEKKLVFSLS